MRGSAAIAAVSCLLGIAAAVAPAQAQAQYKASAGCPSSLGQLPANITADELRCQCFGSCGGSVTPEVTQDKPAPALTCGSVRGLANKASVGFPEGYAAQTAANQNCPSNRPNDYTPPPPPNLPARLEGQFRLERGWSDANPGVSRSICASRYSDTAEIRDGRISFGSGGSDYHTWTGVINANNWVLISRDGIVPRPNYPTVVTGPIDNASMYNGYCGRGFFRLGGRN